MNNFVLSQGELQGISDEWCKEHDVHSLPSVAMLKYMAEQQANYVLDALKESGHYGGWDNRGFKFDVVGGAGLMGDRYDGQRGHLVFIPAQPQGQGDWLQDNPEAAELVRQGLEDCAEGRVSEVGHRYGSLGEESENPYPAQTEERSE
jgi:hypothetical protein